ncbi:MAG: hypothetical protein IT228_11845 [Flavobacteriales bacterium]|nr:hypothetical protein [Flavobacteriales bacterium]MCC6578026.1 hypothetical protein [Flavobacteriales bacterium]NUQ14441.1 hypothetical protein [Flavobacteriales bacterium]
MKPIAHARLAPGAFTLDGTPLATPGGTPEEALRTCYQALAMDYPKFHKMDLAAKLTVLVAEPVVRVARERGADLTEATGVLALGASGCLGTDVEHWRVRQATGLASPAVFVYTLPNIGVGELTIRHGMHGPSLCLMTEAPDAPEALMAARLLRRDPRVRWLVCLWSDIFADRFEAQAVVFGPDDHPTALFPSTP